MIDIVGWVKKGEKNKVWPKKKRERDHNQRHGGMSSIIIVHNLKGAIDNQNEAGEQTR